MPNSHNKKQCPRKNMPWKRTHLFGELNLRPRILFGELYQDQDFLVTLVLLKSRIHFSGYMNQINKQPFPLKTQNLKKQSANKSKKVCSPFFTAYFLILFFADNSFMLSESPHYSPPHLFPVRNPLARTKKK